MMKKLGLLALILGLVIAFAMPALAFTIDGAKGQKMYIGGTFMTDFGYWHRDKELIGGPGTKLSERTEFFTSVPNHSTLRGTLQVGNVGGYWEFGMGGNLLSTTNVSTDITAENNKYIETRQIYGFYNFGNCQILAGKTHGQIYSVVPWQVMGVWQNGHVYGFGWGAIYDQRNTQVRFTQNVTKMVGYQISLVQPQEYFDTTLVAPQNKSYAYMPQVAAKVMLNFGVVSLFPAFAYQNVKWDNVPNNFDDNMSSWYGVLPVKVKVAGFTGTFQGGYGMNLGMGNSASGAGGGLLTLQSSFHGYGRVNGKIKDTTGINGFVDLAYTFGPATPHIYFGYDNAKNSDLWKVGDDNITRMMYGASIDYKVADAFYVIPEFTYYDYGKAPGVASKPDLGKEWIGGVQFRFNF